MEHGLTNGFIPYSSNFKPAGTTYAPGLPANSINPQLPSLGDSNPQKQKPAASSNVDAHHPAPSFQVSLN